MKRFLVVRVPEGCSQPEEIRRGAPACGKRRYPVSVVKKAKRIPPRIKCGIFCALAEETELKGFLVVRVSALSTYAEGLPLCGKRRYPVSVVKKAKRISSPHTMRDFLCFGGADIRRGAPALRETALSCLRYKKRLREYCSAFAWSSNSKVAFYVFQ